MPCMYHAEIVKAYGKRLKAVGWTFEVLGGGILTVDRTNKYIKTYGMSFGYGPADVNMVDAIIRKFYGDWKLELTVTSEVRG